MRAWAMANGPVLERYVAAYVEALRWATATNRTCDRAARPTRLGELQALADATYAALVEPGFGLAPDARFDRAGFANVLALRAEIEGQWGGKPPPADRYVDLRWYDAAVARLGTR